MDNKIQKENDKINILFFVDRLLHGGIQTVLYNYCKYINKGEFCIDLLTLDDGNSYEFEERIRELGINIYKLKGVWIRTPFDYMKYYKALDMFFCKQKKYDIVHMHGSSKNYLFLKVAKKYGVKVRIAHSHNTDFQTRHFLKMKIGNMMKLLLRKYANTYFACSFEAGKWLFGDSIANRELFVMKNAIDVRAYQPDSIKRSEYRKEYGFEDCFVIGHVGRFSIQKNHDFLIDIFEKLYIKRNDARLLLVGSGELEPKIREKVKEKNLAGAVVFAGYTPDPVAALQVMDAFIFPSLYEGLPLSLIEAQAMGVPCFISKDVISSEVNVTGCINTISLDNSAEDWAEIILANSEKNKERIYTETELKEAGFDIETEAKKLCEIYVSLLKRVN